ncbi:MAG: BspA family leucine-rich repeat surface protein [Acutalibacteraceae bacterium]|nr:BspA family leucine-rich repeat surface protein [Acutalibacteraceae bacterium]
MFKKDKRNYLFGALFTVITVLVIVAAIMLSGVTDAYFTDHSADSVSGKTGQISVALENVTTPFADSADTVVPFNWNDYKEVSFDVKNTGNMAVMSNTGITISSQDTIDWNNFSDNLAVYKKSDFNIVDGVYTLKEGATPFGTNTVVSNGVCVTFDNEAMSGSLGKSETQIIWEKADGTIISNTEYEALSESEKQNYTQCPDVLSYDLVLVFKDGGTVSAAFMMVIQTDVNKVDNILGWSTNDRATKYGSVEYSLYKNILEGGQNFNKHLVGLAGVDTTNWNSSQDISSYTIANYPVKFVNTPVDDNYATVDVSYGQDGSVLAWVDTAAETVYVASKTGERIKTSDNCMNMFSAWCGDISCDNLDTSNSTDMSYMFYKCKAKNIDISSFDTNNVTDMSSMFNGCSNLTSLDVSNFDTSNVKNITSMFNGCNSLTSLDLSNFNTSSVTNMDSMFRDCSSLTSLDVSNFDTSSVTNMSYMFSGCSSLTELDLSNFDVSSLTSANKTFYNCNKLTTIYAGDWTDVKTPSSHSNMFYGCTNLVGAVPYNSASVSWEKANTQGYFTEKTNVQNTLVKGITFNSLIPSTATSVVFNSALSVPDGVTTIDLSEAHDGSIVGWLDGTTFNVTSVDNGNIVFHKDCSKMFYQNSNLTSVAFSGIDTSYTKNMSYMFSECNGLTTLDLSSFNTPNLTDISYMFANNTGIKEINFLIGSSNNSNFTVNNVTAADSMFYGCSTLTKIKAYNWVDSATPTSTDMFTGCVNLKAQDGNSSKSFDANYVTWSMANRAGNGGYLTTNTFGVDDEC